MTVLDEIEAAIPALRRFARALARDRDAAEDLVQDCLERAVARQRAWRGEGSVKAWLCRIMLNRFRDLRRSAAVRPHLVAVDEMTEPSQSGGQEAHLDLGAVHRAMGRLPEDQRAALLLVAVEGLTLDEAAGALGVPPGTVASRVWRAREALRQMTGRGSDVPGGSRKVTG